ncbi:MAG: prolipoprotein diacylglyceryl transferase, partial [Parvularculaceae bacterium]|nr:prolipoprotein diacylglyceryl transferase [Parvularculaceae bacterium]
MSFPEIDPVWFHLGPLPIRWYALAYLAGITLGWYYIARLIGQPQLWLARGATSGELQPPLDKPKLDDFVSWIILGVILGGRLGFVLFYRPELMWQGISQWPNLFGSVPIWPPLAVWTGGMSFHGGLIGVAVVTILFAHKRGSDPLRIGDLLACTAPIGLFFGRIANFINGELYGRATDSWIGMKFPDYYDRAREQWVYATDVVARHPSQLYEAALEGALLFAIISFAVVRFRILRLKGAATGLFLAGYGAAR